MAEAKTKADEMLETIATEGTHYENKQSSSINSTVSDWLFDEARKYGVKVVTIAPDMTKTDLYRNADFREGDEEESYLLPEEVADAVEYVLNQRDGVVVTDLTLKPQLHRIKRKR